LQSLFALFFAMVGMRHAFTPRDRLVKQYPGLLATPQWFPRFIGIAELLGAVGLILPMALSVVPRLSVAAGIGLAALMACASVFHFTRKEPRQYALTLVIMLLMVFIVVGRTALVPA
jgi:hypothetical protein